MAEETANTLAKYIRSGRSVPNAGANALRRVIEGVGDYAAERYNTARDTVANALYAAANPQEARQEFASAVARQPAPFQPVTEGDMETAMSFWNPGGLLGKIVWHGSPHKFTKFDASKIGTGEGAQAYGHGVYLADSPSVAESYKASNAIATGTPEGYAAGVVGMMGGEANGLKHLKAILPKPGETTFSGESHDLIKSAIASIESGAYKKNAQGSLYKADLPDEWIPKMLDWDKPLSEQPKEVQAALAGEAAKYTARGAKVPNAGMIIKSMEYADKETGRFGGPQGIAAKLKDFGVTGIRYLDGGSRGAGQGSYNYVVFPGLEDQIKILERNGEPLNALLK